MSGNLYQSIAKNLVVRWLSQKGLERHGLFSVVNSDDNFISLDSSAKHSVIYWVGVYRAALELNYRNDDFVSIQTDIASTAKLIEKNQLEIITHDVTIRSQPYSIEVCDCQMFIYPEAGKVITLTLLSSLTEYITTHGEVISIVPVEIKHYRDRTHIAWKVNYE